jgi:hypothetical protein
MVGPHMIYALHDIPALTDASAYADKVQLGGIVCNMWFKRSDTTVRGMGGGRSQRRSRTPTGLRC